MMEPKLLTSAKVEGGGHAGIRFRLEGELTPNILPTQSRLRLSDPGPDAIISHDGRPQKLRVVFGDVAEMTVFGAFHNRV